MKLPKAKSCHRNFFRLIIYALVFAGVFTAVVSLLRWMYPLKYEDIIKEYSTKYDIDPYLVMGIISTESRYDENAVSHKDAKGLMQLRDETARWCVEKFNIDTSGEPHRVNVNTGCAYFRYLLDKYDNNTDTALAAYNAGEGNVSNWLREQGREEEKTLLEIPFPETEKYVKKVESRMKIYKFLY